MNWLAHLVLSEPSPAFRVGNVLADLLSITELRVLPEEFQAGIARHRQIDSFTDKHLLFKQSIARLDPSFRRYGGVIMDVFYDHLLTVKWQEHSHTDLASFVDRFHDDVEVCRTNIPVSAYTIFHHMRTGRWLTSYGDIDGVRITLSRISRRLRRPFDMGLAVSDLELHYNSIAGDFDEFFPQIQKQFGYGPLA